MPSMFIESSDFVIPREGAGLLLELAMSRVCSDAPTQMDLTLVLFQNDLTPVAETVYGDLVVADFSGYASILLNTAGDCTGFLQGPMTNGDGEWQLFLDQQNFEANAATVPNSVFGAAIVDVTGTRILAIKRFPNPPDVMDENLDVIKVSGAIVLEPQMS